MCPSVMISGAGNFPVKKKENGYATDAPCFLADCKLTVGEGKPEWGAVPGTEYYILKMKNVRRK